MRSESFSAAIQAAGLTPPENFVPGKMQRFPGYEKGAGNTAAWCKLFLDGRAGVFGDWTVGMSETWFAESETIDSLTDADRARLRKETEQAKSEAAAERDVQHAQARERAAAIVAESAPCADHAYPTLKGVKPHGARTYKGSLVLPVCDAAGVLHSLQFIAPNGEKRFLAGGRIAGCYFTIGELNGVVCICEGFATGASIHEATGHAAVIAFNAGNLLAVARSMRAKYPYSKLVLCADDDENHIGETKAREAAAAVGGYLALPDFGADRPTNATDFNDMHQLRGEDAVRQHIQTVKDSQLSQHSQRVGVISEPEPLRRPLPPAEDYPFEALGPILGEAARRINDVVGAPAAMVGQSLLAAVSLAAQHLVDIENDGRREPIGLWCMTIGASGERKSAVDSLALKAHREHERAELETYKRDKLNFDIELQAHEAASRAATKGNDLDAIESRLRALGAPPEAPLKPLLLIGSPTIEGVHKQFISGLPTLGLFHDDAGEFLGGHAMNKENRTKTASGLSCLWDRGEFDRIRAGDGCEKHFGKRLSLHLMLQPVVAETVLSDDTLIGQGFLARCLMSWPASTIGTRQYIETNLADDPALIRYWRTMRELLSERPQLRQGSRNELEPRTITLSPDAKAQWMAVYTAIERDMADAGAWVSVRAWASKAPSQVLRIAAVLTLAECRDIGVIQADTIDRAALLMNHYLSEAVRIVGTNSVPTDIRRAEQLLAWCHAENVRQLHSGAALRLGPNAIRTRQAFDAAVGELERAGWATPVMGGAMLDGAHRRRVWIIRGAL